MHDAKGRELVEGDVVLVPMRVTQLFPQLEDKGFCNVALETLATMPGNGVRTTLSAINTRQILRARPGDDVTFDSETKPIVTGTEEVLVDATEK